MLEQFVEFAVDRRGGKDAPDCVVGKHIGIPLKSTAQPRVAVCLETFAQGLQRVVESREIEAQDDVAVAIRGRSPADIRAAEKVLELLCPASVVVVLQQGHPAGLAEAAGANQKGEALALQFAQKPGLVDVQAALPSHRREVGPAVGDGRDVRHLAG